MLNLNPLFSTQCSAQSYYLNFNNYARINQCHKIKLVAVICAVEGNLAPDKYLK